MSRIREDAKKGAIIGAVAGGVLPLLFLNLPGAIIGAISWGILGGIVGAGVGVFQQNREEQSVCGPRTTIVRNARGCPVEPELAPESQEQVTTHFQDKVSAEPAPEAVQR